MTLENIMTSVQDRIDDITSTNPNPALMCLDFLPFGKYNQYWFVC